MLAELCVFPEAMDLSRNVSRIGHSPLEVVVSNNVPQLAFQVAFSNVKSSSCNDVVTAGWNLGLQRLEPDFFACLPAFDGR